MKPSVLLLLAVAVCSHGSAPTRRSLEALRLDAPFGVPSGVAREWDALLTKVYRQYGERRYDAMLDSLRRPLEWAARYKPNKLSLRTLTFASAARIGKLDYPAALAVLLETGRQCRQIQDEECTAAVETNLSSLYFKIHAMPEALDAADHALAVRHNLRSGESRLRMLLHKARLLSRQGRKQESEALFREVSLSAERAGAARVAAESWETGGLEQLFRGDLDSAERNLRQAFRLRWISRDPALPAAHRNLGLLRFRQHRIDSALELSSKKGVSSLAPDWTVAQMRARAHEAMGDHRKAMAEFLRALDLLTKFGLDSVPPALRSAAADRSREVYDELIGAAWNSYKASPDRDLAAFMLAAASASQALSLRRNSPPPGSASGYWSALAELQGLYSSVMESDSGSARDLAHLRRRLIEIQAAAGYKGVGRSWQPGASEVRTWRNRLNGAALLVFHVSDRSSWTWTLTGQDQVVCQLPGRARLADLAGRFRAELQSGSKEGPAGAELAAAILGCSTQALAGSPQWIVVPDGPLFDVPFAALPIPDDRSGRLVVDQHSVRVMPGTWLLAEEPAASWKGPLLGVADPIYNAADPRSHRGLGEGRIRPQLPRLPASSEEITRCARAAGVREVLVTGADATAERVGRAFLAKPSIIHIATHVLPSPIEEREGLIALSASKGGTLEYLSTEWIASQDLRPELVVLSACRSGSGTIRKGDGLLGLTRAWLQAGARSVIATHWPTPDEPGSILESFYRHRRAHSDGEALRRAQAEAIRGGGWRSNPSYWAGFFLIGRPDHPQTRSQSPQIKEVSYPPKTN